MFTRLIVLATDAANQLHLLPQFLPTPLLATFLLQRQSVQDRARKRKMKKVISTSQAPAAIGPYSQAIKVGNLLFVSGQIPTSPATCSIVSGDIREQTRQALNNSKAIFEEAGLTINDVVKTTVFLTNM